MVKIGRIIKKSEGSTRYTGRKQRVKMDESQKY